MKSLLSTLGFAVMAATILADCAQGVTQSIGAAPQRVALSANRVTAQLSHHRITPLKLLELEVAGKVPGPATHRALARMLRSLKHRRKPLSRSDAAGTIQMWSDDTYYDYLIGMDKNHRVLKALNTSYAGCYDPITIKVDHASNVLTACEDNAGFDGGAEAQFDKTGAFTRLYAWTDPYSCNPSNGCESEIYAGFDGAANASNVFATLTYSERYICGTSCQESYDDPGFFYWTNGSPSSPPTFIPLPYGKPVEEVYYMDLDAQGNIWFDYYGTSGIGIGEIANPTTAPTFVNAIASTGIAFPGGVYASNGGTVLNVTDQASRITTQYAISGSTLRETGTIGPTKTDAEGLRRPVSGSFGKLDTVMGFGDAYGWVDTCTTAGLCKQIPSTDLPDGAQGFAYTPSDK